MSNSGEIEQIIKLIQEKGDEEEIIELTYKMEEKDILQWKDEVIQKIIITFQFSDN